MKSLRLRVLPCAALLVAYAALVFAQTPVDRAKLLKDLQVISADDMEGRLVGTPGSAKARAYIVERFHESGLQPFGGSYEMPFTFRGGRGDAASDRTGVNVVGVIEGKATPRKYVVVTAHYDHLGVRSGQVFNGADDNASGTAALFAVAQYFRAHPPQHSIIVAALDGEEGGLRGAHAFVAKPPVDLAAIVVNVNLDMIGREAADKLFAVGTVQYPFLRPYLETVAAKAPVKLLFGHDRPGIAGMDDWTRDSDHYAFHEAGIPFIYLGVEDEAQHHKATDDYDTMTHDFYVRAVDTAIAVVSVFDANLAAIDKQRPPRKSGD